jgi:hypothetical protein
MISAAPLFLPNRFRLLLSEMNDHQIAKLPPHSAARWPPAKGGFCHRGDGHGCKFAAETASKGAGAAVREGAVGQSGGAASRRAQKATLAAEALFDSEAEALSRKAVELALAGSEGALRICLDRIIAPRRERPIQLVVPPIHSASDIAAAMGAIVEAAAQGAITADEAFKLSHMVDTFVRAIETSDFDRRLQILEDGSAEQSANAAGWCGR